MGAADGTKNENFKRNIAGDISVTRVAALCPRNGCYSDNMVGRVFAAEVIATFLFVSFVLQIVKHNGASDMPTNALAIGLCLFTAITLASGVSGGCVNPAVGFVQPVFQRIFTHGVYPNAPQMPLNYYAAYIFAPALGGILAGIFQRTLNQIAQDKAGEAAANAVAD